MNGCFVVVEGPGGTGQKRTDAGFDLITRSIHALDQRRRTHKSKVWRRLKPMSRAFAAGLAGAIEEPSPRSPAASRDDAIERAVKIVDAGHNALTRSSISGHSRDTWLLEVPLMPIAFTSSSTERVETPWT
jgi:hypothetical protein